MASSISASNARPGDVIMLSGTVGDHGMAVMSKREGLEFEGADSIGHAAAAQPGSGDARAPARSTLCAIRRAAGWVRRCARSRPLRVSASRSTRGRSPVREEVKGACEILGIDPLFVANEGKLVAFVDPDSADAVLGGDAGDARKGVMRRSSGAP